MKEALKMENESNQIWVLKIMVLLCQMQTKRMF